MKQVVCWIISSHYLHFVPAASEKVFHIQLQKMEAILLSLLLKSYSRLIEGEMCKYCVLLEYGSTQSGNQVYMVHAVPLLRLRYRVPPTQ